MLGALKQCPIQSKHRVVDMALPWHLYSFKSCSNSAAPHFFCLVVSASKKTLKTTKNIEDHQNLTSLQSVLQFLRRTVAAARKSIWQTDC